LVSALALAIAGTSAVADDQHGRDSDDIHHVRTATPIKHAIVIFQENVSFDHYFGTYPKALNLSGETPFTASQHTPKVNNLANPLDVNHNFGSLEGVDLLNSNPNSNPHAPAAPNNSKTNGAGASNPFRLSPSQALTADQGHNESPEESAYNNGRTDGFPAFVGTPGPPPAGIGSKALVMGYYDGNTVTALWNYAQHFALNDNNYTTQFGPSTPGAINLISGQANGFGATLNVLDGSGHLLHGTHEAFGDASRIPSNITVIGDGDPLQDACSNPTLDQVTMAGKNIGDLLNAKGVTWGSFMGGVRSDRRQRQRHHRLLTADQPDRGRRTRIHIGRLHSAPRLVPVLCIDSESDPRPPAFGRGHRSQPDPAYQHAGSCQSPV
jgi:hypothetical protein